MNKYSRFSIIFFISVVLDQASKIWIENYFKCPSIPSIREAYQTGKLQPIPEIQIIDGFFSLAHAHNQGAAIGIMQGQMLIFAVFTIIAIGWIGYTLYEIEEDDHFLNLTLALIGSGAIGNAIDRFRLGYVIDFLRAYTENPKYASWLHDKFGTAEWPSFNVADAAIVVGMIMFLLHGIFLAKDTKELDESLDVPEISKGD
ncbi:MAG: signal peptidase II [Myxococcota bacterium]|nr:signal peptidase II [Myxococcota bacterium]